MMVMDNNKGAKNNVRGNKEKKCEWHEKDS